MTDSSKFEETKKRVERDSERLVEMIYDDDNLGISSHQYALDEIKRQNTTITIDPVTDSNVYWSFKTEYNIRVIVSALNKIAR